MIRLKTEYHPLKVDFIILITALTIYFLGQDKRKVYQ